MDTWPFHVIFTFPLYEFSEEVLDRNFWGEKCCVSTFVLIWTIPCNIHPLSPTMIRFLRGVSKLFFLSGLRKNVLFLKGGLCWYFWAVFLWGIVNLKKCTHRGGVVVVNMKWPFLLIFWGIRRYISSTRGALLNTMAHPFYWSLLILIW